MAVLKTAISLEADLFRRTDLMARARNVSRSQFVAEALEKYKTMPETAVIPIPGSQGTDGYGMRRVKANVEKAIGADILFNNEEKGV